MICKIIIHVYSYLIIWSIVSQKNKKLYDLLNTPYGHIIEKTQEYKIISRFTLVLLF